MIAVVTNTNRPWMYDYIFRNINRQSMKPDFVILIVPPDQNPGALAMSLVIEAGIPSEVLYEPKQILGNLQLKLHERAASKMDSGIIVKMEDDDFYDTGYIAEQFNGLLAHPDAGIIGKVPFYVRWNEGRTGNTILRGKDVEIGPDGRVNWVSGSSICIDVETWKKNPGFRHNPEDVWGDASIIQSANDHNIPIYTTSPKNFYYQRWSNHKHVWTEPEP